MSAPNYSASDYLGALQALMPTGRVWPRDSDAVQTQVLSGLVQTYVRNNARASNLLIDAFPATTEELLPQWEATLGLPDPCAGLEPTIQLRRAQVLTRFISGGGQSVNYFIQKAASLGYAISVTQFSPFRFGQSPFGTPMYAPSWAFAWQVNAPTFSINNFQFGTDGFGEPFSYWSNNVLQCELQSCAPAHTTLNFSYS